MKIKICCILSTAEADLAISRGVNALGLVSAMPSGPGCIEENTIAGIVSHVRDRVETFLLTSLTDPDAIAEQWSRCPASTLQLVDHATASASVIEQIRQRLPNVRIIQVIHVEDQASVRLAREISSHVDGLLLDSGKPSAAVRELGGTGRTHDWSLSAQIVSENPDWEVWLAGGLNPTNVREAIRHVSPAGLDICSGLRKNGHLVVEKLDQFIAQVREK